MSVSVSGIVDGKPFLRKWSCGEIVPTIHLDDVTEIWASGYEHVYVNTLCERNKRTDIVRLHEQKWCGNDAKSVWGFILEDYGITTFKKKTEQIPAKVDFKHLDAPTIEKQVAYAKGQRIYFQSMIAKRSAEMICSAIAGKLDEAKSIKEAMDRHLVLIEEINEFVSEGVYELTRRATFTINK